jgi:hypothetical protein
MNVACVFRSSVDCWRRMSVRAGGAGEPCRMFTRAVRIGDVFRLVGRPMGG